MLPEIFFYVFLSFFVGIVATLIGSLIWEFGAPSINRIISDLWYKTGTLDPNIKTVERSDTAKLFNAMRANRAKMFKDGTHILSKNYTHRGVRK